jgi:hypothetical protein
MRDTLHDETDALELIQQEWKTKLEEIKSSVLKIAKKSESFEGVMEEINILAADALADLTTKAIKSGVQFGAKRASFQNDNEA